jgi:hypothetical protein
VGEEATLGDLEIFDCVSAQFIRNIETQLTTPGKTTFPHALPMSGGAFGLPICPSMS